MKGIIRYFFSAVLVMLLLLLNSCVKDDYPNHIVEGKKVDILLSIAPESQTIVKNRATTTDEDKIDKAIFFIFDENGKLAFEPISVNDTKATVALFSGYSYQCYAVTNREITDFSGISVSNGSVIEDLKEIIYEAAINQWDADGARFTMSGGREIRIELNNRENPYVIPVYRICAKIEMKIKSILENFEIKKVSLYNIPSQTLYSAKDNYFDTDGIIPAGYFEEEKELVLNKDGETTFYILANPVGERTDTPNREVLSDIHKDLTDEELAVEYSGERGKRLYAPDNATYVLIESQIQIGSFTNTAKHWVYLGQDNYNNYDVKRNEHHKYAITITGLSEHDVDTRVEVDEEMKMNELEPANSYIVSQGGTYKIPAFCMGNRVNELLEVDGKQVTADYLWTDLKDDGLITDIAYLSDGEYATITFTVNGDPTNNIADRGNMVIALYDEDNNIIWSWHIWVTDTPREVVTGGTCAAAIGQTAGARGKMIIMDRNLGATAGYPEDLEKHPGHENEIWRTYGVYYQMGRKDPFAGAEVNGGNEEITGTWTAFGDTELITAIKEYEADAFGKALGETTHWNSKLAPDGWVYTQDYIYARYAAAHPMEFASVFLTKDARWTDPVTSNAYEKELGYPQNNIGNPFWSVGGHEDFWNRTKTVHDPCPAGWTVLGEQNGVFISSDTKKWVSFGGGYGGMETQLTGYEKVWWPAAGVRSIRGKLSNMGYSGAYFWYDHIVNTHGAHGMYFNGNATILAEKGTNHAGSVRCVKVKQDAK